MTDALAVATSAMTSKDRPRGTIEAPPTFLPTNLPVQETPMDLHKRILEWQAAHPIATWIGWLIVWAVVLVLLFWPETLD